MNGFRFAYPESIHLLWALAALMATLMWLQWRHRWALDRFLSRWMQTRLVDAVSPQRKWLGLTFFGLALLSLVFAAMRPQWGETLRVMPQVGAQIMVCLDVSKSMLAEDTVPNRLERAKSELTDLLALLQGEQVGLVAFAGKATVISPMTTDFGFLRLMLAELGTDSVGRGGTRLEEPIRRAIDGFGDAADISRVILLITDGEDHDSFPLEAAKNAREKGIRIITIGFGDEAGSKIQITDPRTGVRSFVKDRNGQEVLSRLDGETLREIALETEGAYIPAGTGALDLASIHEQHIVPLMRADFESGEQVVRNEAYQWAVVVAIVMLALSLLATLQGPELQERTTVIQALLLISFVCLPARGAWGQPPAGNASLAPQVEEAQPAGAATSPDTDLSEPVDASTAEPVDARAAYNEALTLLKSSPDQAETLFRTARGDAGTDGELRYRAAFNLGWVDIERAEAELEADPKNALVKLQSAADWFREAIRIRPKEKEARHNLEVTMRRILELSDALAQKDQGDIAARLDQLIQRQRALIPQAATLVAGTSKDSGPRNDDEVLRRAFRGVATDQRLLNSDATMLSEAIANQLGGLQSKDAEEVSAEERLQAAQLEAAGHYLGRALQRLGQARSQFRRREADRGFRRATIGLEELKRARDMLRDPREILQRLYADTRQLVGQTTRRAADNPTAPESPAWLTPAYLQEMQDSLTDRTVAWAAQAEAATSESVTEPPSNETSEDASRKLAAAGVLVRQAAESFGHARTALQPDTFDLAIRHQQEAAGALADALELFLDVRGLIEAMYAGERTIQQFANNESDLTVDQRQEWSASMAELENKNLDRGERLAEEFKTLRQQLDESPPQASENAASQPSPAATIEQLDEAEPLLEEIMRRMRETQLRLSGDDATTNETDPSTAESGDASQSDAQDVANENRDSPPTDDVLRQQTDATVERLEALRRIFYTLIEHLRETAERQANVNDETQSLASTDDDRRASQMDRLQNDQQQLESIAASIGDALQQQAAQSPAEGEPQPEQQQVLREAAQLVEEAASNMQQAANAMDVPSELENITPPQDEALQKLIEAIRRLQPPQDDSSDQNNQQQQQQQQNDQQNDQQQDQQQQQQQNMSSRQLLQMIRDREAQRRKDRRRAAAAVEAVEKDW